jgi:hypothetical protein
MSGHADPEMVGDVFAFAGTAVVDGLRAIAVRVEQEGAVVSAWYSGRGPGSPWLM